MGRDAGSPWSEAIWNIVGGDPFRLGTYSAGGTDYCRGVHFSGLSLVLFDCFSVQWNSNLT